VAFASGRTPSPTVRAVGQGRWPLGRPCRLPSRSRWPGRWAGCWPPAKPRRLSSAARWPGPLATGQALPSTVQISLAGALGRVLATGRTPSSTLGSSLARAVGHRPGPHPPSTARRPPVEADRRRRQSSAVPGTHQRASRLAVQAVTYSFGTAERSADAFAVVLADREHADVVDLCRARHRLTYADTATMPRACSWALVGKEFAGSLLGIVTR
jgi:hypothetical protein